MNESSVVEKKRGWGLTLILAGGIVGGTVNIFLYLFNIATGGRLFPDISTGQALYTIFQIALVVVFFVASWQWKKWGCLGYIAWIIISGLIAPLIFGTPWSMFIYTVVSAVFAYAVYKSKEEYFE